MICTIRRPQTHRSLRRAPSQKRHLQTVHLNPSKLTHLHTVFGQIALPCQNTVCKWVQFSRILWKTEPFFFSFSSAFFGEKADVVDMQNWFWDERCRIAMLNTARPDCQIHGDLHSDQANKQGPPKTPRTSREYVQMGSRGSSIGIIITSDRCSMLSPVTTNQHTRSID